MEVNVPGIRAILRRAFWHFGRWNLYRFGVVPHLVSPWRSRDQTASLMELDTNWTWQLAVLSVHFDEHIVRDEADYLDFRSSLVKNVALGDAASCKLLALMRSSTVLIQYYKIVNNLTSLNPAEYFTIHQPSLSSRASSSILKKPFKRPNYVLSSFFLQVNWRLELSFVDIKTIQVTQCF